MASTKVEKRRPTKANVLHPHAFGNGAPGLRRESSEGDRIEPPEAEANPYFTMTRHKRTGSGLETTPAGPQRPYIMEVEVDCEEGGGSGFDPGGIDPWGPEVCPKCQGAKTQRITRNYLAEAFQIAANPASTREIERLHLVAVIQHCREVVSALVSLPEVARSCPSELNLPTLAGAVRQEKLLTRKGEKKCYFPPVMDRKPQNLQQQVARRTAAPDRAPTQPQTSHSLTSRPAPLAFRRAIKRDAKVRLAVSGPSGSGKTYTLLKIASELGGPIALVDTERGSAEKYADLFEFDTLPLGSFSPDLIPRLIETAVAQGYRSLIIDSLSHFWSGVDGELDQVEKVKRRLRDNGFAAWREITPKHNRMIDAMLSAPIHILVSMRVKTDWVMETDEATGKAKPRKIGLQPVMRDGIEYEFDVCGDMDQENTLQITKSRCPRLSGGVFPKPGKDLADMLKDWLGSEEPPRREPQVASAYRTTATPDQLDASADAPQAESIPKELEAIWKRMCTPRGVVQEFESFREEVEKLAGSAGLAEYSRILRQHGVDHPKRFRSSQPARSCAKEVFGFLEELRANARENQSQLDLESTNSVGTAEQPEAAPEGK